MNKIVRTILRLTVLILFNAFLYFVYVHPMKEFSSQQYIQEYNKKILASATGWGVPQTGLELKELQIVSSGTWKEVSIPVVVEVAKSEEEGRIGLMYRNSIGLNEGMIFVFSDEQIRNFWMQNTYLPLDLLYVWPDGQGNQIIKHIHNNAKPLDLTALPSLVPVQYVIEVHDQFVETFGVKTGDKVEGI